MHRTLIAALLTLAAAPALADGCHTTHGADYWLEDLESWHDVLGNLVREDEEAAELYASAARSIPEWFGHGRVYLAEAPMPVITWRVEHEQRCHNCHRFERLLVDWLATSGDLSLTIQSCYWDS